MFSFIFLVRLSILSFLIASAIGIIASLKMGIPAEYVTGIDFRMIRPLHTFFALVGQILGVIGIPFYLFEKNNLKFNKSLIIYPFLFFIISAVVAIFFGYYTGREYISWPPIFSPFLLFSLIVNFIFLFRHRRVIMQLNPEGFWLLLTGLLLLIGGLVESHLWLFSYVKNDFVRDLTIQWHGIDSFIAGINISLYGGAMFFIHLNPTPLRKPLLYSLAFFSLLFTFGHHHYASPQPFSLKFLALVASLIAIFSLLKHLKEYLKIVKMKGEETIISIVLRSIIIWMIVSVASGILFAIPHINVFVHGTHWIIAHAMTSMIGTNTLIIYLIGFVYLDIGQKPMRKISFGIRLINIGLVFTWIVFGIAGTIKSVGRVEGDFAVYSLVVQRVLLFLPTAGILLFLGIGILSRSFFAGGEKRM